MGLHRAIRKRRQSTPSPPLGRKALVATVGILLVIGIVIFLGVISGPGGQPTECYTLGLTNSAAFAAPATAPLVPKVRAADWRDKAYQLQMHMGAPATVWKYYAEAVRLNPRDLTTLSMASAYASSINRHSDAIRLAQYAVNIAPQDSGAWATLAYALARAGNFYEAKIDAAKVVAMDPKRPGGSYVLGLCAMHEKDWDTAIRELTAAVNLRSDSGEVWAALAESYVKCDRLKEGEGAIRYLAGSHPGSEAGWLILGRVQATQGEYDAAINSYLRAQAIDPKDYTLAHSLGLAYTGSNQPDKAQDALRTCVKLFPAYDEGWTDLGNSYLGQGEISYAAGAYHTAININPDNAQALAGLTRTYIRQGQLGDASTTCDALALVDPNLAAQVRPEIH